MISFQCSLHCLYMRIRITSIIWWVMLIIGDADKPSVNGEHDVHPRFRRVRVVTYIEGHRILICCCGYFHHIGLSCRHIFHAKGKICLTDCDIRWYKSYNYHFQRIPRYPQKISQIINPAKAVRVPFLASTPTITTPVFINCTASFYFEWTMRASSPVMMDECFPERLHNDSDNDSDFIDDVPVAGEYVSLFSPQQSTTEYAAAIKLATMPKTINHPYRYHLEAYKHLINFDESDPAASRLLGSLLNGNLQTMVEFTTARGRVETPIS
jgi:hypothetical protein